MVAMVFDKETIKKIKSKFGKSFSLLIFELIPLVPDERLIFCAEIGLKVNSKRNFSVMKIERIMNC